MDIKCVLTIGLSTRHHICENCFVSIPEGWVVGRVIDDTGAYLLCSACAGARINAVAGDIKNAR